MKNRRVVVFSLISGIILMINNIVLIIIPLRMADQNLMYETIGGTLSAFSIGIILVKFIVGSSADKVGIKKFLLISTALSSVVGGGLIFSKGMSQYLLWLVLLGVSRGLFTSVNSAYIYSITTEDERGKGFGNVLGISSFLTASGGVCAGALYDFKQGIVAFAAVAVCSLICFMIIYFYLPDSFQNDTSKNAKINLDIIKGMDKRLMLLCFVVFMQTLVTGPLWNLIVPMYIYRKFLSSALILGTVMSLDEFIGGPVYMVGGVISNRMSVKKMCVISFAIAGLVCVPMLMVSNVYVFSIIFLVCSIFVTGTYISLPIAESRFVRESYKGFEFAAISLSASVADILGNYLIGKIADRKGVESGILLFIVSYLLIAFILGICLKGMDKNEY